MFQPNSKSEQQLFKREFDTQHVHAVLKVRGTRQDWGELVRDQQGVPLVKTLSCGKDDVFQFMHLSFQEALFAMELIENPDIVLSFWGSDATALQRLESPLYSEHIRSWWLPLGRGFRIAQTVLVFQRERSFKKRLPRFGLHVFAFE